MCRTHANACMSIFSEDKKFCNRMVKLTVKRRPLINKHKAGDVAVSPNQKRHPVRFMPVCIEPAIVETPVLSHLPMACVQRGVLGKVMQIKLHQGIENMPSFERKHLVRRNVFNFIHHHVSPAG